MLAQPHGWMHAAWRTAARGNIICVEFKNGSGGFLGVRLRRKAPRNTQKSIEEAVYIVDRFFDCLRSQFAGCEVTTRAECFDLSRPRNCNCLRTISSLVTFIPSELRLLFCGGPGTMERSKCTEASDTCGVSSRMLVVRLLNPPSSTCFAHDFKIKFRDS